MPVENWTSNQLDDLIAFRRDLHENPELLYDVNRTAEKVADALRAAGLDEVVTGIGRTGVVGVIRGQTNKSGRAVALRADMDALPIFEETGAEWSSKVPGKMHACGHDGHTTMLLGAARELAQSRAFDGTVIVIFQPAEEGGAGAKAMIDDGLFKRWPVNEVYGMHNRPNLEVGNFTINSGPIMGSVDVIDIVIDGVGGHAASPHHTIDPIPVTAALIQAIQTLTARTIDPLDSAVISITTIHGGDAFNVIPQSIKLTGTVRTLREEVRDHVEERLTRAVQGIADAFGAKATLDYQRNYPVTVNHEHETELAALAAEAVAGAERVTRDMPATLGGEDFAFMLNEVPGAMINIGNGPSANLHHPKYDFNDDVIAWGSSYWTTLVRQRLPA
ncbi:M20 family metallopeptidase [Brucella pseudogrignonensis]|jgi:hippurate hydrolase|uniref:Amidohydrolase n=1 Tax=Brucella pseudogrignonensis TaxID=419475 RepID=A0A7Y3TA06_9HYPH|nr:MULTISPECIES: M20 aminoacylase family protein [Brucella]EMG51634.1 amidohydrolase [Ochrobactrum sp. CDB2]MQP42465.1 amidohydrolase [Ochrobactrum sp. MYb237]MCD4512324.1 M20 family metallopeptidase [Brucella pseudogrignonensis]NNV23573.1 amidohydrolase [Brucella pseudogrignonensis]PQZ39223.1 amidohydrolase [Brucella pseudogrignonensis]